MKIIKQIVVGGGQITLYDIGDDSFELLVCDETTMARGSAFEEGSVFWLSREQIVQIANHLLIAVGAKKPDEIFLGSTETFSPSMVIEFSKKIRK